MKPTRRPTGETRRGYDETAEFYDSRYSEIQREKYAHLLSVLRPKEGERILDWGCGTGLARSRLESAGVRYFGLDFSQGMLSVHKRRNPHRLVLGDCGRLPFRGESFDGIFSATVLQNLDDQLTAFKEIFRVLKPGGKAALSTMRKSPLNYEAAKVAGLVMRSSSLCGEDICVSFTRPR